jgi:hypothetical protein
MGEINASLDAQTAETILRNADLRLKLDLLLKATPLERIPLLK